MTCPGMLRREPKSSKEVTVISEMTVTYPYYNELQHHAERIESMAYSHVNSKGQTYYLHANKIKRASGKETTL